MAEHLQRAILAAGTMVIKLPYGDFEALTRQTSLDVPTGDARVIYRTAMALLRRTWEPGRPVRLRGGAGQNPCPPTGQLPLF